MGRYFKVKNQEERVHSCYDVVELTDCHALRKSRGLKSFSHTFQILHSNSEAAREHAATETTCSLTKARKCADVTFFFQSKHFPQTQIPLTCSEDAAFL